MGKWEVIKPWVWSALLLPVMAFVLLNPKTYTFLDWADLIIHEAGHFFFRPFGRFLTYAGGTLLQLILPGLLTWNFMRNDYLPGAQLMGFWWGHNAINISVYAADARDRALPLLGNDVNQHDWWNMLGMLDLLAYDQWFGWFFFALAIVAFGFVLLMPRLMRI